MTMIGVSDRFVDFDISSAACKLSKLDLIIRD